MNTDEVYVDPGVAYASTKLVPNTASTMPMIRTAASDAFKKCLDAGRTPVMVEVVIRVAP